MNTHHSGNTSIIQTTQDYHFKKGLTLAMDIFRSGWHSVGNDRAFEFTGKDLEDIAAIYSPDISEAPVVIGHPEGYAPAYGWVRELWTDGTRLIAGVWQNDCNLIRVIQQGSYKKVSISLYCPDSVANPKPGHWYLRHIGLLGATPPSVKGLKPGIVGMYCTVANVRGLTH